MAEIVFMFGAGASRHAGAPLMANFLSAAEDLRNDGTIRNNLNEVVAAVEDLQNIFVKSSFDIENIENVFGAVEMAKLIRKFPGKSETEIDALAISVKQLIVATLENSVRFPFRDDHLYPTSTYSQFSELVLALNSRHGSSARCSMITFNYDLALDYALHHTVGPPSYCLSDADRGQSARLLKLHGSLNWGRCLVCGTVLPLTIENWFRNKTFIRSNASVVLPLASQLGITLTCCGQYVDPVPVLVPPTWNKTEYHNSLQKVWKQAASELGEAERIYIIGYSLPDSDMFFRFLYALGSVGRRRLKRLVVFNPDESVKSRFETLVGGAASRIFEFKPLTFEDAIGQLRTELAPQDRGQTNYF
jgi:NAD-dependent SIR2 family protein deacetylase